MIRVILSGCSGRMGGVLTTLIGRMDTMEVVAGIDIAASDRPYPIFPSLEACTVETDLVIDFSSPLTLQALLETALRRKLPMVISTTGLGAEDIDRIEKASELIPLFRSGNMSLGINLVQQLLQISAKVLGPSFDVEIIEKHHRLKKDAPSGTALMLADSIKEIRIDPLRNVCGRHGMDTLRQADEIGFHSIRGGTIVGEHEVLFTGEDEIITVGHQAFSRQVFATGAIAAGQYLIRQKAGLYSMQDMINESRSVSTLYRYPEEVLVALDRLPSDMTLITDIYAALAENDVFIDMISHTGVAKGHISVSFTITMKDRTKTDRILRQLISTDDSIEMSIDEEVTKLTVEGPGMEFQSGVASRVFSAMTKASIPILAVTTSENKISYVCPNTRVDDAVRLLKEEFAI
ncbi:MAG: 4-hydroxy-tetrahydrodipicolinate reductase [Sphaerochaetaceae bacterium]|nr:4-hydroxy-tetrahydrodipicolinate reductase [Sphaerochaetaceae bacterium]